MEKLVLANMPGLVARVTCNLGDKIKAGDVVVVINIMKTEMEVTAAEDGIVKDILVKEWDEMEVGKPMIILG